MKKNTKGKIKEYILAETNENYELSAQAFPTLEAAQSAMQAAYDTVAKEIFGGCDEEASYVSEWSAVCVNNEAYNGCYWKIIPSYCQPILYC